MVTCDTNNVTCEYLITANTQLLTELGGFLAGSLLPPAPAPFPSLRCRLTWIVTNNTINFNYTDTKVATFYALAVVRFYVMEDQYKME